MSEVFEMLIEHPFLAGMTDDQIRVVAETGTPVSYHEGQTIFSEGGSADSCYLILSGGVALELQTPGHGPQVILTLHDGDLLGWSWLHPPYRWSYDAHVHSDTEAVRFDGPRLAAAAEADPLLGYELMKRFNRTLVNRLQSIRIQVLDVYSTPR
ncbi:MAG: cyclic nucleotide-binding domain-containing protein [Actinomycetota bacterium]|nr:cyclic nucleotide-binding domain-containing protein [Actinomycetota bacterium]